MSSSILNLSPSSIRNPQSAIRNLSSPIRNLSPAIVFEQARYTSACSESNEGYQLVEASEGIKSVMQRELAAWAPSHNSLQPDVASSLNGHTLADGSYCLSFTRCEQQEYSGRGRNFETRLLLASPETMARFGNHPLRALDAAQAVGWGTPVCDGQRLQFAGGSPLPHLMEVAQATQQCGVPLLTSLVELALGEEAFAITRTASARLLLEALFSLLPHEQRLKLSFTTGLAPSPRRPFRFHFLQPEREVEQEYRRTHAGILLHASDSSVNSLHAQRLQELLENQQWSAASRLSPACV